MVPVVVSIISGLEEMVMEIKKRSCESVREHLDHSSTKRQQIDHSSTLLGEPEECDPTLRKNSGNIKLTTYYDPDFGLANTQGRLRNLYLDGLSRNQTGRTVAMAVPRPAVLTLWFLDTASR